MCVLYSSYLRFRSAYGPVTLYGELRLVGIHVLRKTQALRMLCKFPKSCTWLVNDERQPIELTFLKGYSNLTGAPRHC
jgi:hypothetical protein